MFDIDWTRYRLVDISAPVCPPGDVGVRPFEVVEGRLPDETLKYDITSTHTHVGTHIEAPRHFYMQGKGCEDYPLEQFMGRGLLLDVPDVEASKLIDAAAMEAQLGALSRPGDTLLARNSDPRRAELGKEGRPVITPDACRWMAEREVRLFGFDAGFKLGADVPEGRLCHDILMSKDCLLLEAIELAAIQRQEFYFIGLPVAFVGMDSAWCRAVVIEEI